MRWPWQHKPMPAPIVDNRVADRLEQVAGRLEELTSELSDRIERIRAGEEAWYAEQDGTGPVPEPDWMKDSHEQPD